MQTSSSEDEDQVPPADGGDAGTDAPAGPASLLPEADLGAWRGFVTTHTRLIRRLDAELTAAHGMALVEYEVLFTLFLGGGRLRMAQLAERASLSRSGLSRVVDVLEHQRLIRRKPDADDGRAVVATLTTLGTQRLQVARRTHSGNVRRLVLDPLSSEQKAALAAVWASIDHELDGSTAAGAPEAPRSG